MCDLFGGNTQTVVNQTSLPQYQEDFNRYGFDALRNQYELAKNIYAANQNYVPYTGERLQDFTPDQLSAMERGRNLTGFRTDPTTGQLSATGQGATWEPTMQSAVARNTQAGRTWADMGGEAFRANAVQTQGIAGLPQVGSERFTDAGVAAGYMNPYREQVIDRTLARLSEANDQLRLGNQARASAAGAYGGARHGIVESEQNKRYLQQVGDTSAQLYDQAFGQAGQMFTSDAGRAAQTGQFNVGTDLARQQGNLDADFRTQAQNQNMGLLAYNANRDQFSTDQNRMLQSAQMAGQFAGQQQQLGFNDVNALGAIGGQLQGFGQMRLDQQYGDFQQQRMAPYQNFGFLQSAIGQQPMMTPTQTNQVPTASTAQQLAGLGIAGLGAYRMFG